MRLLSTSLVLGSALFFGAAAAVQGQGYDTASQTSSDYNSPSLLPLPDVAPPPAAYGYQASRLRPTAAVCAAQTKYRGVSSAADPAPEPATAPAPELFQASPSDQGAPNGSNSLAPGGPGVPASSPWQPDSDSSGGILGNSFSNVFKGGWGNSNPCCNTDECCGNGGVWFASLGGIGLTRNNANRFWTTYDTTNNSDQLMNTQFAHAGWGGGGEINVGRWFGGGGGAGGLGMSGGGMGFGGGNFGTAGGPACGCNSAICGISATYWGVSPLTGFASVSSAGNTLGTPINEQTQTGTVMMNTSLPGSPTPSTFFFDGASQQSISRIDRINNVEVNFINLTFLGTGRTQAVWLAGIRYFRFDETLTYSSVAGGHTQNEANGAYTGYLRNQSINNLLGPQIGVQLNHYLTSRWSVYATPKFGIFGNQSSSQTTLYTGDGITTFDLKADKMDFSTITQLDLGMNYLITPRCSVYGGYRLVSVNSLVLSDNQFLPYLADTQGFLEPKSNGSLLLNGMFAGLTLSF